MRDDRIADGDRVGEEHARTVTELRRVPCDRGALDDDRCPSGLDDDRSRGAKSSGRPVAGEHASDQLRVRSRAVETRDQSDRSTSACEVGGRGVVDEADVLGDEVSADAAVDRTSVGCAAVGQGQISECERDVVGTEGEVAVGLASVDGDAPVTLDGEALGQIERSCCDDRSRQ